MSDLPLPVGITTTASRPSSAARIGGHCPLLKSAWPKRPARRDRARCSSFVVVCGMLRGRAGRVPTGMRRRARGVSRGARGPPHVRVYPAGPPKGAPYERIENQTRPASAGSAPAPRGVPWRRPCGPGRPGRAMRWWRDGTPGEERTMAEIRVEQVRKRGLGWLWLLLLLALLALAAWYF